MNEEIFYPSINWSNSDHKKWISNNCEYLLLEEPLYGESNVLDIGCYEGKWISQIYSKYKCHCVGLEPIIQFYDSCANKGAIKYYNFGLTVKDSHTCFMNINKDESKIDSHGQKAFFKNAKSFFEENKIKFNLVQMNIEGYEYELIPYMFENNLFDYIETIQIQFHEISNLSESKYNLLKSLFLTNGFKIIFDYKFVWTKFSRR